MSSTLKGILGALALIATVGVVSCQAFLEERGADSDATRPSAPHLQPGLSE